MVTYEISLILATPDKADAPIRVSESYIDNERSLGPQQKAAIKALPPGGVWKGKAIQVKRLED
jgi:hypothetical protein